VLPDLAAEATPASARRTTNAAHAAKSRFIARNPFVEVDWDWA